ncbi:MAG: ApbE family lipoprotein [Pseudomonadota bacterium]|jgi:thiamine biosynthesis lipoprotein
MRKKQQSLVIGFLVFIFTSACQHKPTFFLWNQKVKSCVSEHRIPSMGTFFEMQLVHACDFNPEKVVVSAKEELDAIESELSLYQTSSQLSRLNRDGFLCPASPHLLRMTEVSIDFYERTAGRFDVSILPVLKAIEKSFEKTGRSPKDLSKFRALVNGAGVSLTNGCLRFKSPGMALTFDGVAKGYAVDRVAEALTNNIDGYLLNFSGNMRWYGEKPEGPWKIAVWNPVARSLISLAPTTSGAIASSGSEHVHYDSNSMWHHLIDPKTLRPSNRYQSVTVVGSRAMECDILSTTFFVLELTEARRLQKKQFPQVSLYLINKKGELQWLPSLKN